MKIMIVGDVHNNFGMLNNLINHKKPDLVLACGDFGYWEPFVNKWAQSFSIIKPQGSKILWCDGNHEHFWDLAQRKSDEIVSNVIYMPRGSTYTLPDGRTILFMGGALSTDKEFRTIGQTWFPEETITQKDLHNLPDIKIDIIISHTCPKELLPEMLKINSFKTNDPSNEALSQLWEIYKPKWWFYGHWHEYVEIFMEPTNFICLGDTGFGSKWWKWLPGKEE